MASEKMKKKRADKIAHILSVATEAFSEKGFHGALTDEIAERAGVPKLSLYYYVGDKAALYDAVWKKLEEDFSPIIYAEFDNNETAEGKMRKMIRRIAEVSRMTPMHSIALRELLAGGENLPPNQMKNTDHFLEKFSLICEELKAENWDINVPPIVVAWMIYSFFVEWKILVPHLVEYGGTQQEIIENLGLEDVNEKLINIVEEIVFKIYKPQN